MIYSKQVFGLLAALISFVGYYFYLRNIFSSEAKPHAVSWLIWSTIGVISFFAQDSLGAGPGSWLTGSGAVLTALVFLFTISKVERKITKFDLYCLLTAGFSILLWLMTSTPLYTIILVSIIDIVGFLPTFRKTYSSPYSETLLPWVLFTISWLVSIMAIQTYNFSTLVYPGSIVYVNTLLIIIIYSRQRAIKG